MRICIADGCQRRVRSNNRTGYCTTVHLSESRSVQRQGSYASRTPEQRQKASEATARHIAKNREIVREIKLQAGCIECGYNEHPAALDFDHVRGEKLYSISSVLGMSLEILLAEIAKCEVVCAIHHRIRTFERGQSDGSHAKAKA